MKPLGIELKPEYATIRRGQTLLWASNLLHGGSPQRDKSRTRYSQVTHFFFEGCRYWTPLHSDGEDIEWRRPEWITDEPADEASIQQANARLRGLIETVVPTGATVLVASRGDDDVVTLAHRQGWHFPRDDQGVWQGHYPADSTEAIAQVEDLRTQGAGYIVFPDAALWWLDHYDGLAKYLESRGTKLTNGQDAVIFALP